MTAGTPPPADWPSARLAAYEAAVEAVNRVVGALSSALAAERAASDPDPGVIAALIARRTALATERTALDPDDDAQIASARARYTDEADAVRSEADRRRRA